MRILLLTFYYPPDLSAGAFRTGALVQALKQLGVADLQVNVVTTLPNRYKSFTQEAAELAEEAGVTVRRIGLPPHKSGMRDQTKAFIHFARGALRETRGQNWDIVIATSSRLMTAALGARIARRAGAPLYLDIRDLFTDTIGDVLGNGILPSTLLPVLRAVEARTFRSAAKINIVSPGFEEHLKRVAPNQVCSVLPNGIDDPFLEASYAKPDAPQIPTLLYAGNIGEGQGLERIVPESARMLAGRARFRIVGDGGRQARLLAALDGMPASAVELLPPVQRDRLIAEYRDADILFLHLNDYAAFEKVLPSKIFEYAATGKPILAGVKGYAAQFLKEHVVGAEVFSPTDAAQMIDSFERLMAGPRSYDRSAFIAKFSRRAIMREFAEDVVRVATGSGRTA